MTEHTSFLNLSTPLLDNPGSIIEHPEELPAEFYESGESVAYEERRKRKDFGAYYTDDHFADVLSSIVVEKRVSPLVDAALQASSHSKKNDRADQALSLSICDPMVGAGVFLANLAPKLEDELWRLADAFSDQHIDEEFPMLSSRDELSEHIYSSMLYGVDLDARAIAGAAKNITAASTADVEQEELVRCLSSNLKQGDALFNPLNPRSLPNSDTLNFPVRIKQLYEVRQQFLETSDPDTAGEVASLRDSIVKEWSKDTVQQFPNWYLDQRPPFCWELEFPEIFYGADGTVDETGGFDIVIGNPPWDVVKHNDQEFFDEYHSGFSKKARAKRDELKEELLEDDSIQEQYEQYCEEIGFFLDFVKSDQYYQHQTSGRYGHTYNTYKLASELAFNIAGEDGIVSLLTPSGIIGEAGSAGIRKLLFNNAEVDSFWSFKTRADVFDGIDQKFCVHMYSKGGETESFRFADNIVSVDEFEELYYSEELPQISAELVQEAAPETFSLIPARTDVDVSVLESLYEHPLASDEDAKVTVNPTRELDETKHRHHIIDKETKYRFAKGKCVHPLHFDPEIVDKYVEEDFLEEEADHYDQSRIVWRDIARPSLRRRMFVTVVPPNCGVGNSLNYVVPNHSDQQKRYIAGVMQSWIFEYRARQISTNSHINMYVVRQIPIPRLAEDHTLFREIVAKVDQILNTDPVEQSREEILNEIDALAAHAYNLSLEELKHVLSRFEKLEKDTIEDILDNYSMYQNVKDGVVTND